MRKLGPDETRRLTPLLLAALIAVPGLFCWLLLRKGYAASLRWAGFSYAAVISGIGLMAGLSR